MSPVEAPIPLSPRWRGPRRPRVSDDPHVASPACGVACRGRRRGAVGVLMMAALLGGLELWRSDPPVLVEPPEAALAPDRVPLAAASGRPSTDAADAPVVRAARVEVTDAASALVEDARARAVRPGVLVAPDEPRPEAVRLGDGRIELPPVAPGAWTWVVEAPGFVPATVDPADLPSAPGDGPRRIVLQRGETIEGTVVDEADQPVAGARVRALGRFGAEAELVGLGRLGALAATDLVETSTDARGHFELRGVAGLPVRVAASKGHFAPFETEAESVAATPRLAAPLRLRALWRLAVDVVDAETGRPVPTATFTLRSADLAPSPYGRDARASTTPPSGWDADHRVYVATGVAVGDAARSQGGALRAHVRVSALGYDDAELDVTPVRCDACDGRPEPVPVRLQRSAPALPFGTLRVRVTGRHLALVEEVGLRLGRLVSPQDEHPDREFVVPLRPSGDGLVAVDVPAGRWLVGLADGTGWLGWRDREPPQRVEVLEGTPADVTLRFEACLLTVRVRGTDGAALVEYWLQTTDPRGRGTPVTTSARALASEVLGSLRRLHPDPGDGVRRMLLAPGTYGVTAIRDGWAGEPRAVELRPGADAEVTLTLAPR